MVLPASSKRNVNSIYPKNKTAAFFPPPGIKKFTFMILSMVVKEALALLFTE